jgi:DNA-binding beta-propeller fold protein YncE
LTLERTGFVRLPPGAAPGFDHADVYPPSRRLYVAHTRADRVDVIDTVEQRHVGSLDGLPGVAGVLVEEASDLLFTSDRACARVSVFRASTEELLGQVEVRPHPNGLAYDLASRRLYSFNLGEPLGKGCTASVVDVERLEVCTELALPGRPRWAVYDEQRQVVYANIRDPALVVVVDCERTEIDRAYEIDCEGPHGLWLDEGRLFCAADGGELIVLDRDTGAVRGTLPLPGAPDVVMHDAGIRRLYVAIGEPGVVCTFDTAEEPRQLATTVTEPGAHTLGLDPVSHHVYVFCPVSGGAAVYAPA